MSINPDIRADGLPTLVVGETLLIKRTNMRCISKIEHFNVKSDGVLYFTTLRLIFVASQPTAQFTGLDIPLVSIRNEKFNQPIFGSNNLSMDVVPQANWGQNYMFTAKFEFRNGGAQTFLRIFWKMMSGVNEIRNIPTAEAIPEPVRNIVSGSFVTSAFVDPTDPTFIYTAQPYQPTSTLPQSYPTPCYYIPPHTTVEMSTMPPHSSTAPSPHGQPPVNVPSPYNQPPMNAPSPYNQPPVNVPSPYNQPPMNVPSYGQPPMNAPSPHNQPPMNAPSPYNQPPMNAPSPYGQPPMNAPSPYNNIPMATPLSQGQQPMAPNQPAPQYPPNQHYY